MKFSYLVVRSAEADDDLAPGVAIGQVPDGGRGPAERAGPVDGRGDRSGRYAYLTQMATEHVPRPGYRGVPPGTGRCGQSLKRVIMTER